MRQLQANSKAPDFNELVSLTRKTMGTVPLLQQALAPFQPDLIAACVYGSVAKQTDTAQSDVDVLLVGTDLSLSGVLAVLEPAEAELGRKITPQCFTPQEFALRRKEPDSFVNRVLAQPTLPLIGDLNELANTR